MLMQFYCDYYDGCCNFDELLFRILNFNVTFILNFDLQVWEELIGEGEDSKNNHKKVLVFIHL